MSINFPTAGSTSALYRSSTDLSVPSNWSFYCWYRRANAASIDNFGSFGVAGDPEIDIYWRSGSAGAINLDRYTSGTRGRWEVTAANMVHTPAATKWLFFAITQSGTGTPVVYHSDPASDAGPVSRTVTTSISPSGTASTLASRRPVYANSWFSATFDAALNGDMAWAGWHNVVLTPGELHEAMWRGMTLRGLIDHRPMWTATDIADLSGSANAGTTSGSVATVAAAPPVVPLWVPTESEFALIKSGTPPVVPTIRMLASAGVGT